MIKRERYLNQLIRKQWNNRIKIITGIRRCGKSTLLFEIFRAHLIEDGVCEDNIICIALDDDINTAFRSPDVLSQYVRELTADREQKYYLLLDEIQYYGRKFKTKEELIKAINDFMDYYVNRRVQRRLGVKTPAEYYKAKLAA